MTRGMIEVVQIRGIDVKVGDVVHARPDEMLGWFLVDKVAALPNGMIAVTDESEINGFLAEPLGIVGLQIMVPLVGASHPPAPGHGPASASDQAKEAAEAADAEAAAQEAQEAQQAQQAPAPQAPAEQAVPAAPPAAVAQPAPANEAAPAEAAAPEAAGSSLFA